MDNEVLVTVICNTYNQANYIRDALNGFLSQKTDFPFEVIVHDDASTDGTTEIVMEYAEKYPDIIVPIIEKSNRYQKGLPFSYSVKDTAKGKYIAICEGDDYWCCEDKLQIQINYMLSHPECRACVHNTAFLNVSTGELKDYYSYEDKKLTLEDCVKRGGQSFQTSSVLAEKNLYLDRSKSFWGVCGIGDYPRAIQFSIEGNLYYFGKVMSVYRSGVPGSWTSSMNKNREKRINHKKKVIDMLKNADESYSYKYHDIFQTDIINKTMDLLVFENKIKELYFGELKKEYRKKPFVYRLKALLKFCIAKIMR